MALHCMATRAALKRKFHHGGEHAFARQFVVKIDRHQIVIAIAEVQHTQAHFGAALRKAVTGENIELPEVISGNIAAETAQALLVPVAFATREESTAMA